MNESCLLPSCTHDIHKLDFLFSFWQIASLLFQFTSPFPYRKSQLMSAILSIESPNSLYALLQCNVKGDNIWWQWWDYKLYLCDKALGKHVALQLTDVLVCGTGCDWNRIVSSFSLEIVSYFLCRLGAAADRFLREITWNFKMYVSNAYE